MTSFVHAGTRGLGMWLVALTLAAPALHAQTLPPPWASRDVGAPSLAGRAGYGSGVFTVEAAGTDIWGTSDQFHFVYQQVSGDVEIVARVDDLTAVHAWAKAGVMIRASLAGGSPHGFALVSGTNGVHFQRRTASGGLSTSTAGSSNRAPVWLRAVRTGTRVTTAWSTNGTSWSTIGSDTIALGTSAYVGVAVTSHRAGTRTTSRVSNVRVTPLGLSAPQQSTDIGAPAVRGSASFSGGTYTITAGGRDIWDRADEFHFVYQPLTGNGEVIARVASIVNTHRWAKAGVMIRESLTPDSRHAMMVASVGSGYAFQRRPDPGAYSVHTSGGSGTPPGWVRLVRSGTLFEAYRSTNGSTWSLVGSDHIPMGSTVYVGLAVTSHNTSAATTAVIDSLRVTAFTAPGNAPPAVTITAPASGTTVTAPATVTIAASASDPENRMASVDFYVNSTLLARDSTSPYSVSWSASAAGVYTLTAVAHDADGNSTTSGPVTVTVEAPVTTPPRYVVFTASSDHATNVTSYLLEVFASGANPSTAAPIASSDLGKPAPASNGDITVDRGTFFSNLAPGNYVATVTAIGPGGRTRSGSITFAR